MLTIALVLAATLVTEAEIPRLSVAELHEKMQTGDAVAVDVRGSVPWRYGHIAGAVWLPLGKVADDWSKLPQDKLLVTYCTCKAENLSLEAAMALINDHGFERVAVLKGGYPAWKAAGLPIVDERKKPVDAAHEEAVAPEGPESAQSRGAGRVRPPAAVTCDRNQLTSYAGRVTAYARAGNQVTVTLAADAGTSESVTATSFLLEGEPFNGDWTRIESEGGKALEAMSAIAWVCTGGTTFLDWRPGASFDGAQ